MATWRWADLSTVAKLRPVPVAAGNPFAYGVPVCDDEGGPSDFQTGGCPIRIARVVYRVVGDGEEEIYELSLDDGEWYCNNLSSDTRQYSAPSAAGDPTAYVSPWNGGDDFVATVNYVAGRNVVRLYLTVNGWIYQNILDSNPPKPTAMPAAPGSAFGYYDSDNGVDRVVYLGYPPDKHIYELSNQNGSQNGLWACNNLSTNDKSEPPAPPAAGNPFGYSYSGVPRVIYRGTNGHIYELHPEPFWRCNDLSVASGGAPPAQSDPYAYVMDVARVIYTDTNGQIIELELKERWEWNNLSTNDKNEPSAPAAAGKPFGYVTYDGTPRVIYRGTNGHIYELHPEPFWRCNDLSAIAQATSPAQVAAGDPFGYEIFDNIPRVVYRGTNGHIYELALY